MYTIKGTSISTDIQKTFLFFLYWITEILVKMLATKRLGKHLFSDF